jgi:MFS superfamily sulfate permease-like transporter
VKLVAYPLAVLVGLLGIVFIAGSQGVALRIVVGVIFLLAAGAIVWLVRHQTPQVTTTVVQKIDLSGDVKLENLTCRNCGGTLSEKSLEVRAGAVFVHCEYCGTAYQLEEDVKW